LLPQSIVLVSLYQLGSPSLLLLLKLELRLWAIDFLPWHPLFISFLPVCSIAIYKAMRLPRLRKKWDKDPLS
jgi:hypothetical protein